jgi:CRP/FNR family transcriptional regulator
MSKLLASPLFSNLPAKTLEEIEGFSNIKRLRSGEELFRDGDPASNLFVVLDGRFKIFKVSKEGKEQILHFQKFGDLIAEAAIFDRERYPASCSAMTDSKVMGIPKERFVTLLSRDMNLVLGLLGAYSRRLRGFVSLIEDLSLNDVKKRVARFLLEHAERDHLGAAFPKKEVAALIGTTPESFSRALKAFKSVGWIQERDKKISLIDKESLKSICE